MRRGNCLYRIHEPLSGYCLKENGSFCRDAYSSGESKKFASAGEDKKCILQFEEYAINYHTLQGCYGRYQLIFFQSSLSLNSNAGEISILSSEMNSKYGATKGTSSG